MAHFLSDEWFELAGLALAEAEVTGECAVAYVVEKGPSWTIQVGGGSASLVRGVAPEAAVTLTMTAETAAAVARGDASAQAALMRGDLKIGGDVRSLIDASPVIDQISEAMGSVRASTDW